MKNNKEKLETMSGSVGYIPKPLKLENKPELNIFPFNVLMGKYMYRNGEIVFGHIVYEPDLSSLGADDEDNLAMNYINHYDRRFYLKMIVENDMKSRKCIKYKEDEIVGESGAVIDPDNEENSWKIFFAHVALIGFADGEMFSIKRD